MKTNIRLIGILALVSLLAACNQTPIKQPSRVQSETAGKETTVGLTTPSRFRQKDKAHHRTEKRYALVIGNANYVGDPNIKELRNPINDASDMAKTLKEVAGFNDVMLKINLPNREAMENALHQFSLKLEKGSVGLFYYAGHGVQADGKNYLIPTQVSIPTQVELKRRAMPANFVLDKMEYARNDLNIIILDACRNNPLPARGPEVLKSGLAEMPSPAGSILIFSTAPGKGAYDGDGRNGVFTKHLLKGIKKYGYVDIEQMLKRVRNAVERETFHNPLPQVPWQDSSLIRDFCFSPFGCETVTRIDLEEVKCKSRVERAKAEAANQPSKADTAAVAKAKQQLEEERKQLEAQRKAEAKRKLAERQAIEAEKRRIEAERRRIEAERQQPQQQPTSAPAKRGD
jgi:hypothetical protein